MIIVDKFHKYCENEFNLSELDSAKLKYSLQLITGNLSKLLILFFLFSVLGYRKDFIYSFLSLLSIRIFTGGLHLKTYTGCLIFSAFFFCISIFLKNNIALNHSIVTILFILSILITITMAPVCGKSRPDYSYAKRMQFKITGISFILIHFLMYFFKSNNSYFINAIWAMSLQCIQILIAKGGIVYEKFKPNV
ncbi:AgrB-like protein [Gottschalkia acidurici 9a]|uniref:AgrB-like protein n=1 Tax=Gottschalkia acidurici (strain ATCC 7906 / DSM 604 / BCRC 14475 / CIP 104303 / KCTC 5404 / NCIMB 10678 / 9a) TaxID=1128398 RepID=K0AV56_GOTA9|nr:accessory gene regulator B family protein [Gottschalkia acidurici]AFS77743.1 AgrB-like protein [Gottschalkia acidurici 9a]